MMKSQGDSLMTLAALLLVGRGACTGDAGPDRRAPAGPRGPQGPQGSQGPAGMPAAQGLAGVSMAGVLVRGVNVASVQRVDVGRYRVTFINAVNVIFPVRAHTYRYGTARV